MGFWSVWNILSLKEESKELESEKRVENSSKGFKQNENIPSSVETNKEVTYYKYHPGKYMLAFLPKASELNEHTSTAVRSSYGDVFFKQIAGTFARRIVCHAQPGTDISKSDECGIIKFGSRIDMYLPLDAEIKVKLGDTVRGSETVIAELRK